MSTAAAPVSVYEAFARTAETHAEKLFLIVPRREGRDWAEHGLSVSYGQALSEVKATALKYRDAGYGHGHRVALLLEQRPEFIFHYLALNSLGIGIVPINPDYRHDEMLYQMSHSEAALAVTLPHRVGDLERVGAERVKVGGAPLPVILATWPDSIPRASTPPPSSNIPSLETEAGLLYTSGTTGRPKGCRLSNFYYLTAGSEYAAQTGLAAVRPGEERFYNPLPLFHMNHQAVTLSCAILTANALVLTERFSPQRWWSEIVETGATIIHYLGIVAPTLLNQPDSALERQHRVRFGVGAGIEPELHATFEARFGFPMIEVWGMTETGRVLWNATDPRSVETRAFGRASATLAARVVDEHDQEVADGVEGELVVRHTAERPRHGFFTEYLANAAATAEAWRGGWFHTGDVVRRDATGMFHFVDRKKNIIRRSGENIAAAEIEAVLQAHAAVAQVAVIAAPDEVREEEVFACIVPMPGVTPSPALADDIFATAQARLAYYKPPGWILFVETLPTTGTQKVQKTQIFPAGTDPRRVAGAIDLRARKKR
jgi:acyl-CoA synthetase (AMP-forming)/AMP-acid ligase II